MDNAKKIILFLVVMSFGCAKDSSEDVSSNWRVLKNADRVQCYSLPQPASALNILDLKLVNSEPRYFFSETLSRKGQLQYYIIDNKTKKDLNVRDFRSIPTTGALSVLADQLLDGSPYIIFMHKNASGSDRLILEDVTGSRSRQILLPQKLHVEEGEGFIHEGKLWLTHKTYVEDESLEDAATSLSVYGINKRAQNDYSTSYIRDVRLPARVKLLFAEKKDPFAFWLDENSNHKKPSFKYLHLADKTPDKEQNIVIPIKNHIENWSVIYSQNALYMAYIEGDSLIGNALLRVAKLGIKDSTLQIDWIKTMALLDEHAGALQWVETKRGLILVVQKWLDKENTLALYAVGEKGKIVYLGAKGIYSEKSTLRQIKYDFEDGSLVAIIKMTDRLKNKFNVCRFSI